MSWHSVWSAGFAVDRIGRFYVYDGKDAQIRQYDANAKFVRNIGRKGKGPGEYEWVIGMDIAEDSLLVIHDLSARASHSSHLTASCMMAGRSRAQRSASKTRSWSTTADCCISLFRAGSPGVRHRSMSRR